MRFVLSVFLSFSSMLASSAPVWTLDCPQSHPHLIYRTMLSYDGEGTSQSLSDTNPYNIYGNPAASYTDWYNWRVGLKTTAGQLLALHAIGQLWEMRDDIEEWGFDITYQETTAFYDAEDDSGCVQGENLYTTCTVPVSDVFPAEAIFCADESYYGYTTQTPFEEGQSWGATEAAACDDAQALSETNAWGQFQGDSAGCNGVHYFTGQIDRPACDCALVGEEPETWGCIAYTRIHGVCKEPTAP